MNLKCKSYKEMNIRELIDEITRVKMLLVVNQKPHTQKQNKKYLSRLEKEYYKNVNRKT